MKPVTKNTIAEKSRRFKTLFKLALPSIITGGAGDDPAGVLTYTTIGATTGFGQLWLMVLSTPMLVAAVSMADRIARTSRAGLTKVLRNRYGRTPAAVIVILLLIANIAVIAADVSAVAEVFQILTGLRWEWFVPVILLVLYLILRAGYARTRFVLTLFALGLTVYAVAAILAHPDWETVLRATFVPQMSLSRSWMLAALGLLGATISPYMLFWQADEETEELQNGESVNEKENMVGIWGGMIFSNVISLFIIIAAAVALHNSGNQISTVFDAAKSLSPLGRVGDFAFTIGIIGAGLLALPVFAGTSAYAMAELFGWKEGLDEPTRNARGFYTVLGAALFGGAIISLIPDFDPADALFYSQVFNGVLLPLIMIVLLMLSNDTQVMGSNRNPLWVNLMGGTTILVALGANFAILFGG